jgi:PAS domain S-box-containing protein
MTTSILVIDDSEDDQRLYQRAFKDFEGSFSLVMVSSAEAGFALLADLKPDLILLDYNLPDLDGLGFVKRLGKYLSTSIPIIMLTGEGNAAIAVEAMKNGVDDYIVKDTEGHYLKLLSGVVGNVLAAHAQREQNRQLRQETEALLHRNQTLMQNSMDGIHVMDMQGNILEANDAFCHMLGYTQEEMARLNVADWDAQWSDEELRERFQDHIVNHARFETVHRRKDGSLINVEISTSSMKIEEQYFIFAASHDITERKYTEQALRESEERWHFAIDGSGDGVWDWNLVTGGIVFSERYLEMLGYESNVNWNCLDDWKNHVAPEEMQQAMVMLEDYLDGKIPTYSTEYRMQRADGGWAWILARGKVVSRAADGRPLRLIGTHTDITERKYSEQALRIAAATFDTHEAILITDVHGNIVRVNSAFTDITGYREDEVISKNPRIMSSGRQDKAFYIEMWQQLLHTGSWGGEIWDKRKNGQVYPKWLTITAVKNDRQETTHYVAIFSDITARKQAEDEIRNLAFYDSLTQLPNRRLFMDRFRAALTISVRRNDYGAVLFIDLDRFKMLIHAITFIIVKPKRIIASYVFVSVFGWACHVSLLLNQLASGQWLAFGLCKLLRELLHRSSM